jgi:hypothetical protein
MLVGFQDEGSIVSWLASNRQSNRSLYSYDSKKRANWFDLLIRYPSRPVDQCYQTHSVHFNHPIIVHRKADESCI